MAAERKIPPVFRETHLVDVTSLVRLAFMVLAAFAVAIIASRLGESDQSFAWVLVSRIFLLAGIVLAVLFIKEVLEQRSIQEKRKAWIDQSLPARLEIMDRKKFYDEYVGDTEYTLTLQLAHIPGLDTGGLELPVRVSREVYEAYREKGHASIHYSLQDPLTFIIDGEEREN